jgi:hypothetical protein
MTQHQDKLTEGSAVEREPSTTPQMVSRMSTPLECIFRGGFVVIVLS